MPERLELMKEVLPGLRRVAVVGWPRHAGEPMEVRAAASGAARLGPVHEYRPVSTEAEVVAALDRIARWRADAILAFADAVTTSHAGRIAAFSLQHRIPAVSARGSSRSRATSSPMAPTRKPATAAWPASRTGSRSARALGVRIPPAAARRTAPVVE